MLLHRSTFNLGLEKGYKVVLHTGNMFLLEMIYLIN